MDQRRQAQMQQLQGMQARSPRQQQRLQYLQNQQQRQTQRPVAQPGRTPNFPMGPAPRPGTGATFQGPVPRPGTGQPMPKLPQFPGNGIHGGMQFNPGSMPGLQGQNMGGLLNAAMDGIKGGLSGMGQGQPFNGKPAPMPGRSPGFGMEQAQGEAMDAAPMQAQIAPGGMNMGMRPRGNPRMPIQKPYMGPGGMGEEY